MSCPQLTRREEKVHLYKDTSSGIRFKGGLQHFFLKIKRFTFKVFTIAGIMTKLVHSERIITKQTNKLDRMYKVRLKWIC